MRPESSKNTGPTCPDGETCEPSRQTTDGTGESTLSAGGFHVRTSRQTGGELASPGKSLPCFLRSSESLARFDHGSSSWRTWQTSFLEEWETFSGSWPLSGMMRGGIAFRLQSLVSRSDVCGRSLFPTLQVADSKQAANGSRKGRDPSWGVTMTDWMRLNADLKRVPVQLAEEIMGFPIGWTELPVSETPSSPKSPNGLGAESLQRARTPRHEARDD